jgi:TRAP-type uncharacterized transport system substrate-binding protein
MPRPLLVRAIVLALCLAAGNWAVTPGRAADPGSHDAAPGGSVVGQADAAQPARPSDPASGLDLLGVEIGGSNGITVRLGEDLANLMDDGSTRRMVPMVGRGGLQNIADLLEGRAVDMALLQLDVLEYARSQKLFPDIENKLTYITKLNYVEFHLLARSSTTSVADLGGQIVNVGPMFGDTSVTASQLFRLLNVTLLPGNDEPGVAIEKLRRGEIGAVAFVGGKPAPLLRMADAAGLHLVPIPLTAEVVATYIPTRLNAGDYPGLVAGDAPVDTIAVGTGLFVRPVAPGSEEYRKLAGVVDTFFTQFQTLLAPGHHGKWAEVNLSSQIPGWQRFAPADEWLKRNASTAYGQDLRMIFMRFLDEREKSAGAQQMSQQQRDALFDQFRRWQSGKND